MTTEKGRGRPSSYTQEKADAICQRLADGETLRQVCRDEDMPAESTVRGWALDDVNGFCAQYTRAREIGYMSMADELLDISDDGENDYMANKDGVKEYNGDHLNRSRLRVDTRKWLLSKALPKVYGDKIDIDAKVGTTVVIKGDAAKL